MDEHEDVDVGNDSECRLSDSVHGADETLIGKIGFEGQGDGGSLSEGVVEEVGACNGEDIMVEVLGSDVFVDGVCSHGSGGNSNEEAGRGELVEEAKFGGGGGSGDGDLAAGEVGVLRGEIWNRGVGSGGDGSSGTVELSGEQTQVGDVEGGLTGGSVEDGDRGREVVDGGGDENDGIPLREVGVLDGEARNADIESGVEGSLVVAGSMGGETQSLVLEKVVEVVNEKCMEGGLDNEVMERGTTSVDGGGGVPDGMAAKNIGILNDEVWNPGIEAGAVCSTEIVESSSVQTQVVAEEAADKLNEEGLNEKNEVPAGDALEGVVSGSEKDEIFTVETACEGSEKDGGVHATTESFGGEMQVDGSLCGSLGGQQLEVETVGGFSESHGGVCANLVSFCAPTQVVVEGEVASVNDKDFQNLIVEAPKTVGLGGASVCSDDDCNLNVELGCESTGIDNQVTDRGEIAAKDNGELLNSKIEVSEPAALDQNISYSEKGQHVNLEADGGVIKKDGVAFAGSESLVEKIQVIGGDSARDQELKVMMVGCSTENGLAISGDLESSGGLTQVVNGNGVAAIHNKEVSNPKTEVPKTDSLDRISALSENDQNLNVETAPGGTGNVGMVLRDSEASDEETRVADGGEGVAMDVKKSLNEVEVPCSNVSDENLYCSVGEAAGIGNEDVMDLLKTDALDGDEKPQAIVGPTETFTVEVHEDQILNSITVEEISNQGTCVTLTSDSVAEVAVGSQAALNSASLDEEGNSVSSDITYIVSLSPDGNLDSKVLVVSHHDSLPDGDQTMGNHVSNSIISHEVEGQAVGKDESCMLDNKHITVADSPKQKVSQFRDNESIVSSLTVSLGTCPSKDGDSLGEVCRGRISLSDDSPPHKEIEVPVTGGKVGFPVSECIEERAACDLTQVGSNVGQEIEVEEQVTDAEPTGLHGGQVIEDEEQVTDAEPTGLHGGQEIEDEEQVTDPEPTGLHGGQEIEDEEQVTDAEPTGLHGGQEIEDEEQATDAEHAGLEGEQELEAEDQVNDAKGIGLHGGQELEAEGQITDTDQLKTREEEIIVRRSVLKSGSSVRVHQASYQLPPENEGEFSLSDLVWGKVRSHPWWPGQIFDPSDSSEKAMKYHKKDCFLVAYFGDRTFAWNEASLLKPFRTHFSSIEKQSNSETFHNAVNCALEEVSRRVELGLTCSCMPEDTYDKIKFQIVENTGIRQESSRREGVDESASAKSFAPDKFVDYIKALAQFPSGGADRLELVIAKAQLLAFYHLKGGCRLPEFQFCAGLLEDDAEAPISEDKKHSCEVYEHGTPIHEVDEHLLSAKGKLRSQNSSSHKRKHNLKDSVYPKKKERSMSELMGGALDDENGSDGKSTSKLASSSSGKKRKTVDSFDDDSVVQDRRKTIFSANVSNTTSPNPRQSFKIGECIRRVASQLTGSPSILKCSGERFQKVDLSNDKPAGAVFNVSFQTPEDSQRGKMIVPTDYSSLDEMLSQLQLAARDPMKGYSFLNIIISFFSDFRNSIIPSHYSRRENSSMEKAGSGRKKKAARYVIGSPETFEFEDMKDSYWTDRIIQNGSEEQPSRRNKRGGDCQLVTVEPGDSLQVGRRLYSRKKSYNGSLELAQDKPLSYMDERKQDLSPTELILNFPEVDSIPSETNLNKMFRRFGPLKESETEVDRETSRARVVFKRCSDAEVAFSSAGKFNIFGPTHVNYQLSYSPSVPFKVSPVETTLYLEDAI